VATRDEELTVRFLELLTERATRKGLDSAAIELLTGELAAGLDRDDVRFSRGTGPFDWQN